MKLSKEKWSNVRIEDVASIIGGGTPSRSNPDYFKGIYLWIGPTEIPKDRIRIITETNEKLTEEALQKSSAKLLPVGTILFTTRATIGEVAIAGEKIATSQSLENFVCNPTRIDNWYLAFWLKGNQKLIHSLSAGTTFKGITRNILAKIEIPLPPLEEQKQIAALFQSIETAVEKVEEQEKNFKVLQKSLVDGLLKPEPEFGNLLNNHNCTPTTIGEIAECDKKYPEHEKEVEYFVGLENIEPENFQLQGFGLIANGTTFTKRFAKGDVLFGKRRAYLKKVAVADFDGICSGDILVIRAKPKKMLQGLLPFYISSDAFIQHAVSTSAGSLSPRTKWKDLAELEVSVPDLKTQETILEIFTQLQTSMQQLKQQKNTLKQLKQKLLNEILSEP